jgi:hypothetical protein
MPVWAKFVEEHPRPHLVIATTEKPIKGKEDVLMRLILALTPKGKFALRREFDRARGTYVILMGFESEVDAKRLADSVDAKYVARYPGYSSQRAFVLDDELVAMCEVLAARRRPPADGR